MPRLGKRWSEGQKTADQGGQAEVASAWSFAALTAALTAPTRTHAARSPHPPAGRHVPACLPACLRAQCVPACVPRPPAACVRVAAPSAGRRRAAGPGWPRRTLPAEDLYLSHSVFPFETTIFLERFPLERERFLIFPSHALPSAVPGALRSLASIGHIVEAAPERSLTVSSGRPAPVPDARGSHWLSCCEARRQRRERAHS